MTNREMLLAAEINSKLWRNWYRNFLRDMKQANLKVEDMPNDVAQSALVIHQHALKEEHDVIRQRKKEVEG